MTCFEVRSYSKISCFVQEKVHETLFLNIWEKHVCVLSVFVHCRMNYMLYILKFMSKSKSYSLFLLI